MRYKGQMVTWKDDKGFGFVITEGAQHKIFAHINDFAHRSRRPIEGDKVSYDIALDQQKRERAINIRYSNEKVLVELDPKNIKKTVGDSYTLLFCGVLGGLLLMNKIPLSLLLIYFVLCVSTFIAYALDKSAAQQNRWRTKESTLHLLSLLGGWIGALFAQNKLRHKSTKKEFQQVFWVTVFVNSAVCIWMATQGYFVYLKEVIGF